METASFAQMADEPSIHRHRQTPTRRSIPATVIGGGGGGEEEEDDEFYIQSSPFGFEFDSFSPTNTSSNHAFLDDYAVAFDIGFDLEADNYEREGSNGLFSDDEEDEQMNFVSDLFERNHALELEEPGFHVNSGREEESTMEFGFGSDIAFCTGVQVLGINSVYDSEEFEVNSGFIDQDDDNYDSFEISNNHHRSPEFEREEFEWEEVSERILVDDRENLNSVINRIEEISVSSDISSSGEEQENTNLDHDESVEEVENTEWEVLLEMSNIERTMELADLEENNPNGSRQAPQFDLPGDYILTMEHNALFGELVENANTSKGSPPAARSVVENLPWTVLTKKEIVENKVVSCAVCKDEFTVGEKVTSIPCCHMYHGSCILPWLSIRNTCPVCRYELPTDDADYETRRCARVGRGVAANSDDDLPVRYNFEVLPL